MKDSIAMTVLQHPPAFVLGLDVAKDTIAVFDSRSDRTGVIANTRTALRAYLADLTGDGLAVCEPTGGHEAVLLDELAAAGLACHRADALKVRAFRRSFGTLAKTDAIDARALARYGQERWSSLSLFSPASSQQANLSALIARRQDLVDLKVAETNRLKAPGMKAVKASCKSLLRSITRQLEIIDAQVDKLIAACQTLRRKIDICQSLPGVGPRTAIALAALMPELGSLPRRQAAALAGVAPHPNDTGTIRGYRKMRGGRPEVRTALFMAAMAASRAKGPLRKFYQGLIEKGKKPIVAIAAIMRKIIVILNARIRDLSLVQS